MRVTKAIREYVEEQIKAKYNVKRNEVGKEYEAERESIASEVEKILNEANEKALTYLQSVGYENKSWRENVKPFQTNGRVTKEDVEQQLKAERAEWDRKCSEKTKQVLFDLEMGETAKAELKDVLDNLVVD